MPYCRRLSLAVDENDRIWLGGSSRGDQPLDVHLVGEAMLSETILDISSADVEICPGVGRHLKS